MGNDTFRQGQPKRGHIEMNAIIRTQEGATQDGPLHETARSTNPFDEEAAREVFSSDAEGEASVLFHRKTEEHGNADETSAVETLVLANVAYHANKNASTKDHIEGRQRLALPPKRESALSENEAVTTTPLPSRAKRALPSATLLIDEATAASSSTSPSSTPKVIALPQGQYSEKPTHGALLDPEVILALQLILNEYRRCFSDSRDIATHRGLDLLALDGVLTQDGITHVKLHDFLMNFRKTMLTGLIIEGEAKIPTGHSRLRKGLKVFCVHPQYNKKAMQARDNRRKAQDKALQDKNTRLSHPELNLARYFEAQVETLESLNDGLQKTLQATQEDSEKVTKKYQDLTVSHTQLVATQQETLGLLRLRLQEADQKVIDVEAALWEAKRELKQLQEDNARLRLKGASAAHKASTASTTGEAKSEAKTKTKPLVSGKEKENTCQGQHASFWTRWMT